MLDDLKFAWRRLRSTPGSTLLGVLALTVGVTSCAADEPGVEHDFAVTVEDGVAVALTTGGPRYDGEIFEYEKVLEIRPDPEIEESILYDPYWMTVDQGGNFYVADQSGGRIAVFDPEGNWVRDIGRPGQGPGEFRFAGPVEIVDGSLWAGDSHQRRYHRFGLDGTVLDTVSMPSSMVPLAPRVSVARMWVVDDRTRVLLGSRDERRGDVVLRGTGMGVADAAGEVVAFVETETIEQYEFMRYERGGGGSASLVYWFAGFPTGTYARGRGMYLTTGVEPEVRVYGLDGSLERRLRLDLPPQPVTDEDRAWAIGRMERALERELDPEVVDPDHPPAPTRARVKLENPRFAESKAYWYGMQVDDAGYVWLGLDNPRALPSDDESRRFRVLSPEGEYLGDTTAPDRTRVTRGYFFAMLPDPATGETVPTVYRIRSAVDGFDYP